MATLADFRSYIREHLDLDSSDLPDTLVDEFIRDGAILVQYHRTQWPWHETQWTLPVVAGTQTYDLQADAVHSGSFLVSELRQVRDPDGNKLTLAEHDIARGDDGVGTPVEYRLFGDQLTLDVEPSASGTYVLVGYRQPVDWVADGAAATPDTPSTFDGVIRKWALGNAYAHQEEGATASFWMDSASFELERLSKRYNDMPPERIVVNSRGPKNYYGDTVYPRIVST